MAIVFVVAGIILLAIPDTFCAKAEKILIDKGASESKISEVEASLQSSSTALANILLLVGGVAGASVILSLRVKDKLCVALLVRRQYLSRACCRPDSALAPPCWH